jgi:hypothetical protein
MTGFRRASLPAALLVSLAVIVAACGGSAATPTPVPAGEATPPPAGDATPTPEPTPPGEATPGTDIPTIDLNALTGAIPGVDSYRTSFSVGGTTSYETVVVTKPVLSKAITTYSSDGSVESRLIVIGDQIWQANGADGAFEVIPGSLGQSMLMAFDPTLMLSAYANLDWATGATDQGTESKNGVQARHLRIDPSSFAGLAGVWPAGAAIDIWVAEAGYIVGWEMTGFEAGQDVSIQVSGVNDPANKVEAPN